MKHLKFLFLFVGLVIFASCSESDVENEVVADSKQAVFSGAIGEFNTRVTNNSWDKGDAIGIFALIPQSDPPAVYEEKYNVQYVTTGGDKFSSVDVTGKINFPNEGGLDFAAYYPWQDNITKFEYNIVAGTDPLYSNNAKYQSKDAPNVDLEFHHMLSKLVLNIELGYNSTSLKGLEASLNNVVVDGKMNLASGVATLGNVKHNIAATVDVAKDNKSATLTSLMMPTQDLKNVEVQLSLGGNYYKWSPKSTMKLASNKEYIYNLKLNVEAQPYVVEIGTITIKGWDEGYRADGFEALDPEKEKPPLEFASDVTKIEFDAITQLLRTVKLTAAESHAWTITKNAEWLTLNPQAGGTGSKDITVSATKNTATTQRTAIVAIIPTDNNNLEPIIITVIQKGKPAENNNGTKERPYTVAEAVANQGEKGNKDFVWVEAYIVGTEKSGLSLKGAVETNLLIADNKEESDIENAMPAELPDNKVRTNLNLKNNPEMYKAKVLLYGTLEDYFKGPGMKSIKDYELISTN